MKKIFIAFLVVLVLQAIVASISGHKIFGSAVVVDNRPLLSNSVEIDHLEAPNVVVTTRGERLKVEGVVFEQWAIESPAKDLHKFFSDSDPVRICSDPKQPSGVAFEWRIRYSCGTTFSPMPFPKPLPMYRVADFGRGLVARMQARDLATEDTSIGREKEPTRAEQAIAPNRSLPPSQKSASPVRGSED